MEELGKNDLPRLRVIESVCARLEFAELAKYAPTYIPFSDTGGRPSLTYQTDRLVAHLALTTLDVIAREQFAAGEFSDFPKWLTRKLAMSPLPATLTRLAEDYPPAPGKSLPEFLAGVMSPLQEAYYQEQGVSRLFNRLLVELDPWMLDWLCSVFFLANDVPFRDTVQPSSLPWRNLPNHKRITLIAKYLYFVRNLYTHTTSHLDAHELSEFRLAPAQGMSFSIRYTDIPDRVTDKVEWFIALRSDIPESEAIRMIAVHLLRKWIGFTDGPSFIDNYLIRLSFRFHAYRVEKELTYNSTIVGNWATIGIRVLRLGRFDLPTLLLATSSISTLSTFDFSSLRYRPFLIERLQPYLQLASSLNAQVRSAFEAAGNLQDTWNADASIRSDLLRLARSPQAEQLLRATDELHQTIDQTLSVPFY